MSSFDEASEAAKGLPKDLGTSDKLGVYALFKCSMVGECTGPVPSSWDMVKR